MKKQCKCGCGKILARRDLESTRHWDNRRFYDKKCAGRWRSAQAEKVRKKIRKDLRAGIPTKELAHKYGCTRSNILKIASDAKIKVEYYPTRPSKNEQRKMALKILSVDGGLESDGNPVYPKFTKYNSYCTNQAIQKY